MKSRVIVLLGVMLLSSCVRVDVGDNRPTLGDELRDLARARDAGTITDAEFAKVKRLLFDAVMD